MPSCRVLWLTKNAMPEWFTSVTTSFEYACDMNECRDRWSCCSLKLGHMLSAPRPANLRKRYDFPQNPASMYVPNCTHNLKWLVFGHECVRGVRVCVCIKPVTVSLHKYYTHIVSKMFEQTSEFSS